jgi:hypothetical protein
MPPLKGLKRVVVLARHGNRAPNPQILELCKPYAREVLPKFGVAPAALSRVGMSENHESGEFLRARYGELLGEGPFTYDGKVKFFSERADRNIVSTSVAAQGLFPLGTGLKGYTKENPNVIPIPTTEAGVDVMMNCPRDGPCKPNLSKDKSAWFKENTHRIFTENKELFAKVSKACETELTADGVMYKGKMMPLVNAAKLINDALTFAATEGLDPTVGGRFDEATIKEFHDLVEGVLEQALFGKPEQLTYWSADWIPTALTLSEVPLQDGHNSLHFFLNHRELIYSSARLMQIPIQFPGQREGSLPTGCMLAIEVYEEGVRLFFWAATRPSHDAKAEHLSKGLPMEELYTGGTVLPAAIPGCETGKICPLSAMKEMFVGHVSKTGTWAELCGVTEKDMRFRWEETHLGIMAPWLTRSLGAQNLFAADGEACDLKTWALAAGLSLATGLVGFKLGSAKASARGGPPADYVQLE